MYGSSLMWVTFNPRASISAPMEAAPKPLPIDDTTPPVTKTNLVRLLMTTAPQLRGASTRLSRTVLLYDRGRHSPWRPALRRSHRSERGHSKTMAQHVNGFPALHAEITANARCFSTIRAPESW